MRVCKKLLLLLNKGINKSIDLGPTKRELKLLTFLSKLGDRELVVVKVVSLVKSVSPVESSSVKWS